MGGVGVMTEQPSRPEDGLPTGRLPSSSHLTFTLGLCLRWFGQTHIVLAVGQSFVRRLMESKQRTCTCLFATTILRKSYALHDLVHFDRASARKCPSFHPYKTAGKAFGVAQKCKQGDFKKGLYCLGLVTKEGRVVC